MKRVSTYLSLLMFLVATCGAHVAHAQPAASFEEPVKLRVSGTLHPNETPPREDLVMVNIVVDDKPMLLRVGLVEELTRTERMQAVKWGVLLRQVRFYGPTALVSQLQEGKALTIEGSLDTKGRQFLVSDVKASGDMKSPPPARP
ncbi:MAG: hypothetical protein HOP18_19260 [Deltaproteobacteria bacterium]|nr:hypothetical protein [Deltaproteobacteria bacterium]